LGLSSNTEAAEDGDLKGISRYQLLSGSRGLDWVKKGTNHSGGLAQPEMEGAGQKHGLTEKSEKR
jgi:hypothetical protein